MNTTSASVFTWPYFEGKPSRAVKTDDTVLGGLDLDHQHLFVGVPEGPYMACRPGERLSAPLTLAAYDCLHGCTSRRCRFDAQRILLHDFRHGMAGHVMRHKLPDKKARQPRVRALVPGTVKRYGKAALEQWPLRLLGPGMRLAREALLKVAAEVKNSFLLVRFRLVYLLVISRLRHLRSRLKALDP